MRCCRALSYQGAEFLIAKIKMEPVFKVMYDRSCEFWHLLSSILNAMTCKHKRTMGQFYGAQQRFYRQMLMAAKVRRGLPSASFLLPDHAQLHSFFGLLMCRIASPFSACM